MEHATLPEPHRGSGNKQGNPNKQGKEGGDAFHLLCSLVIMVPVSLLAICAEFRPVRNLGKLSVKIPESEAYVMFRKFVHFSSVTVL